jgi:hypothetical protein
LRCGVVSRAAGRQFSPPSSPPPETQRGRCRLLRRSPARNRESASFKVVRRRQRVSHERFSSHTGAGAFTRASARRPFHNSEIGSSRRPSSHGSISRTRWLRCASADGEPPALEHDGGCGEAVAEFQRRERAYVDRTASGALANSRACSVPVTAKIRCISWQPRTSTRRQSASLRRARAIKIACRPLESMNVSSLRSRITAALPRAASDRASASCGAVAMSSSPLGVTRVTPGPSANHVQANPEAGSDHRESSDG